MRFIVEFAIPMDAGNATITSGTLPDKMQSVLEDLKPEAAYFSSVGDGVRGGYLIVNIDDASQIPAVGEPLFLGFNATVKLTPVMTPEDLMKAGPAIGGAVQKYG